MGGMWYFYPRPPGGGRPRLAQIVYPYLLFLSTPSGWRATTTLRQAKGRQNISIHALRVEGDSLSYKISENSSRISIHALRVEGDV